MQHLDQLVHGCKEQSWGA